MTLAKRKPDMGFADALDACEFGNRIRRQSWIDNGSASDRTLPMQFLMWWSDSIDTPITPPIAMRSFEFDIVPDMREKIIRLRMMPGLYAVRGDVMTPWLPSASDMTATDWEVLA